MGNTIRGEGKRQSKESLEGLRYRSIFETSVEKKRINERNNNKRPVNIDSNSVSELIKMVHENVMSQKLRFDGSFGPRRCKFKNKKNCRVLRFP